MGVNNKNMMDARFSAVKVLCVKLSGSFRSLNFLVECKNIMAAVRLFLFGLHVDSTHNVLVIGARNIKFCMII